jgi:hypothetical protein
MKPLKLTLAWLMIGIPLAWGVFHSVKRSMPLFNAAKSPAPVRAKPRPMVFDPTTCDG